MQRRHLGRFAAVIAGMTQTITYLPGSRSRVAEFSPPGIGELGPPTSTAHFGIGPCFFVASTSSGSVWPPSSLMSQMWWKSLPLFTRRRVVRPAAMVSGAWKA